MVAQELVWLFQNNSIFLDKVAPLKKFAAAARALKSPKFKSKHTVAGVHVREKEIVHF